MDWTIDKTLKIAAIVCYALIMLQGSMIALPFGFWLVFTAFEFDNPEQFYALLGVVGLVFTFYNHATRNIKLKLESLAFLLLITPILRRLFSIPIKAFNYPSFIIPTTLFVVLYWLAVLLKPKPQKTTP
ncbi:MAG: hypothetical protein WBF67_12330 [Olleya sp.]